VAHRVAMLADRPPAKALPPATAGAVRSLVPLPEILAEITGSGVASKAVAHAYDRATATLGPDRSVLEDLPIEAIAQVNSLLGEAVSRLRSGRVIRQAGYDGEYGVIRLFEDGELDRISKGELLFDAPLRRRKRAAARGAPEVAGAQPAPLSPVRPVSSGRAGLLAALDADQCRAAEALDGPLLVVAGPGSGKTRMLTHRLAHLVVECRVPASACLAITFTRRATEELKQRLHALLPAAAGRCAVHSFHSLGLAILRAHGTALGLGPDFRIAPEPERAVALAAALGVTQSKAARLLKAVSVLKRTATKGDGEASEALAVCRRLGIEQNWVDFDDLVGLAVEILEVNADVAALWRQRFQHVSVDEFQDVDEQQYRLLRRLAAPDGNICVIGDPNQAIYGFRGAAGACFERFGQDFPTARTIRLGRNYRSTGTIVTAAAQVMGGGTPADIMRPMEAPITLHVAPTERAEAEFVASTIESLMGGHDMLAAGRKQPVDGAAGRALGFADFAVLYRTDAQSAALREAFDRTGVPFKKSTPAPIAGQASVQAVLQALESQDAALCNTDLPARLAAAAEQVRRAGDNPGAASLAEARRWLTALAGAGDAAALRERVALSTEADFWDARADRVSLLTMHAAKGLEFPVVFVVGLEDGLVPFSWTPWRDEAKQDEDGPDEAASEKADTAAEERRLFYVAMTRAKDRLLLSRAAQRFWRGRFLASSPSPFLRDIADDLLTREESVRAHRSEPRQYSLF